MTGRLLGCCRQDRAPHPQDALQEAQVASGRRGWRVLGPVPDQCCVRGAPVAHQRLAHLQGEVSTLVWGYVFAVAGESAQLAAESLAPPTPAWCAAAVDKIMQ